MLFLPLLLWTALFCHTSDAQVSSQNRNKGRGGSRDGSRVGSRSSVPGHPTSFRNEPVLDLTPKFFIIAPAILRLGTKQNILLEAHSLSQPVTAILSIEFPGHPIGPWIGSIMLNSDNDYSALITVEYMFRPHDMRKKYAHLTVMFGNFHRVEQMIKFSYQSGYIFIQTDKPIYNPGDTVRYRAFVSNPEFQAFESTISLEIQNPDEIVIHALARANANDGILSNAYTLPAMAKEGRWKVVAKFDNVKENTFSMPFEVKKYVLPAFNVTLTPKKSHFSLDEEKLEVEVTARYLYGERVQGVAYVLFGVEKEGEKRRVSSMKQLNDLDGGTVSLTMEEIKQTYPNTHSLVGASLYVKASVMTSTGSDLVEAEKSGIKIVLSPYVLSFRDTPQYFKPGLPFDMTVTVSHHDGSPAPNIPFRINFFQNPITEHSGTIKVSLNMPATISSQIIIVETLLPGVKAEQQAVQELRVEPYLPFNTFSQNYLYISVSENRVEVGQSLNIKVHISMSSREHRKHVKQLSYAVLNKGNIIKADRIDMGSQDVLNIPLLVTTDMLPAFRLVAYFMLPWQFNAEVVADSVLVDVEDQCVGSLSVGPVDGNKDLSISSPGNSFKFHVKGDSGAKVSLVAVDNAIFLLNKNRLTQKKLWEMVGKSDMGCTTGGGKNSMAVFSNAGLMFYSSTGGSTDSRTDNCPKRSRRRRSAARRWLSEQLEKEYSDKSLQRCCADGMREIPMPYSCYRRSLYITEDWSCVLAFRHCCAQYRGEKLDPVTSPPTTTLPPTTTGPPTTISVFSEIHPTHEVLFQLPGPQGRPDSIGMPGIEFLPGLAIRPGWPGQSGRPGWALETGERGLSRLQEEPDLVFEEIDEVEVEEIDEDEYADMDGLYVRSKFFESWLWVDIRLPNEPKFGSTDGLAVFPVETVLPDSITQWGFLAISASPETGFCVAEPYNVKAWKPFFIDLRLPHSVSRNEHVEIKAVIYNYKKEDLEVLVILDKTEDMCSVAFNKPHRQHVSVRASSSVLLKYTIIPLKTGDLPLQLTALTRFSDNDVVQKTLRVVVEGIQRTEARSFVLNPSEKGDQAGRQLITVKKAELDSVVPNSKPETFINVIDGLITDSIDNSINKDALAALIRMPGGCVEQNLASMTFPIIAAHYLDRSEQWDSIGISRKEEAIKYIQKGYENQLNYRKPDDSYPPYLREGTSTWITAYVVKVFSMARPFISVSKERLCGPLLYLLEHKQEPDGSFKEDNPVYTTRMTGGLRGPESRTTLTAFVLIAMQENIISCNKPGLHIWERYTQAATYLRERFFKLKRPYSAAIACYALELSSQGCMKSMLLKLASPDRTHWPDSDNRFFTLEATGYALLALIKGGHMEEAAAPFRWLNEQRGIGGGYGSTQSTMVVLQALSEYLVRRPPPSDINLLVELSVPGRKNMRMSFLPKLVPKARTTQVPLDEDFTVVASGNGKGILEVVTVYHQLPKAYENSTCNGFQLDVSITETKETPPDVEKSYRLNINVRALDRQQVRMVILDVGLPTGFEPENSDLELLTNSVDHYINNFKVVDNLSDRGSLIIHLFRVSSTETDTISFRLHQKFKVGLLQPSTVTVYQYYNKDKRCSRFYSPPEEKKQLDQICKDDVCRCTQGDCCVLKADSLSSSKEERKTIACKERHYAYKVRLVSVSQNHYYQYEVEIIQIIQEGSETGINKKDRIVFLSHGSCRANLNLRKHRNYLVIGPLTDVWRAGSTSNRYVYTLGKSTWVERWPAASECGTDSNLKVKCDELKGFAAELTQSGC